MALTASYYGASGPAYNNCFFLGLRFEEEWGYRPREGECWILGTHTDPAKGTVTTLHTGTSRWITALWMAPSGALYAVDTDGRAMLHRDLRGSNGVDGWEVTTLPASLGGVFGLDDQHVYAWGSWKGTYPWYAWDGVAWQPMADPGFDVRGVHGLAPDFVYAVGLEGQIARWDGARWHVFPTPTREILTSVFVASGDEMYAVGNGGTVLEGSATGWGKIAELEPLGPLNGVAKYQSELWIGGGRHGLFRRVGNTSKLECVKPKLWATGFDTRAAMVISCEECIANTTDGKAFVSTGRGFLLGHRAGIQLLQF